MKQLTLNLKPKIKRITKTDIYRQFEECRWSPSLKDFYEWCRELEEIAYQKGYKEGLQQGETSGYYFHQSDSGIPDNY